MWTVAAILMGAGTAMVYPTLLAVIGDVAHPAWRARAVGVYRLWRDLGYAVGALIAGITADLLGLRAAIWLVAAITAASGLLVAVRMYETHPRPTTPALDLDGCSSRRVREPACLVRDLRGCRRRALVASVGLCRMSIVAAARRRVRESAHSSRLR
jgi:MFS family permease